MTRSSIVGPLVVLGVLSAQVATAQGTIPRAPRVGEVRMFVIPSTNGGEVARMHKAGWLEARGQRLSVEAYPELYRMFGRAWTEAGVPGSTFALPNLAHHAPIVSADNPYGVLGGEDMPRGGRRLDAAGDPEALWVYVGRPVADADAGGSHQ